MQANLTFADYEERLRAFIAQSAAGPCERPAERFREPDSSFERLALDLFALQFRHNAAYQRYCAARGVSPDKISRWPDMPAVPTSAFKELELTSLPAGERAAIFHSSGTTGQAASRHFHSAGSLAVYEASLLPWFQIHVLPREKKFTFITLTPPPAAAPRSSLVYMFESVRRAFGTPASLYSGRAEADGAWALDSRRTSGALEEAVRTQRPVALLGTAFSFVHLIDRLAETETVYQLPAGSRALETGGYKGRSRALPKAELHARIHQHLGIPSTHIVCEYGMSELSSQAYDRIAGRNEVQGSGANSRKLAAAPVRVSQRVFRFPPWARVRIISPETGKEAGAGQTGLVRVYDLANVRSVLAVQTEDLGRRHDDGFELIGRAAMAEARGCSWMAR